MNEIVETDFDLRHARSIASVNEKGIKGVVVFSRFNNWNCEWTAASVTPYFLSPFFVKACFRYAFVQCNLRRVSAVVDARNERSQKLLRKLGFTQEAELESMFGDYNGLFFKMLKKDCKWIN